MELTKEVRVNNLILRIYNDDSPESPREWDNLGTMICFHRNYDLGDKDHGYSFDDYDGWAELEEKLRQDGAVMILPIYMYEHSGVTISTKPFSCKWDSGRLGLIYVTREKLVAEYGEAALMDGIATDETLNTAKEILEQEVETYDTYIRGEVYKFRLYSVEKCEKCGHEEEEMVDSCSGFFGDEHATSGILDNLDVDDETMEEFKKLLA